MNPSSQRGFSLIELVVAITMVAICSTTVMSLMSTIAERSAEVLLQQQAAAIANAYIQEALSKPFAPQAGGASHAGYNDVADFNFTDVGAHDHLGNPIAGLSGYRVQVTTQQGGIAGVAANEVYQVVVTVTDPRGQAYSVTAFKLSP